MKILVIEDEKKVALALQKGLESEHYDVQVALTAHRLGYEDKIRYVKSFLPSLVQK